MNSTEYNPNETMPPVIIGCKEAVDREIEALGLLSQTAFPLVGDPQDQIALAKLEEIIVKGTVAAYAVGAALENIHNRGLYKNRQIDGRPFKTFEEYCKNVFTISRIHAYRLIAYHYVRDLLGEQDDCKIPERLVRPLTSVVKNNLKAENSEVVKSLWKKAKQQSHKKIPPYDVLAEVVGEYKAAQKTEKVEKKKSECPDDNFFSELLGKSFSFENSAKAVDFIIAEAEKAKKKIERLQALYIDFEPHVSFSADDKTKLIQTVREWQKTVLDEFTATVGVMD